MRGHFDTKHGLWLLIALLLAAGCGARRPAVERPKEEPVAARPQSLEMEGSVIQVAAPEGDWRFEARSERAEAAGAEGPYALERMEGRYEQKDKAPVLMRAQRAQVDRRAERVTLEGSVWVGFGSWQLEADRVEYDLKTGKVVAEGRTKWTFRGEADRRRGTLAGEEEKRP